MRAILVFAVVFMLLFGGIFVIQETEGEVTDQTTVTNESFNATSAAQITLNESNRHDIYGTINQTKVYNNDSLVTPEGNWTWDGGNGVLDVQSGSVLIDADDTTITYKYGDFTNTNALIHTLTVYYFRFGELIPLIFMAGFLTIVSFKLVSMA